MTPPRGQGELRTADLDWREVRDALWLARTMYPPSDQPAGPGRLPSAEGFTDSPRPARSRQPIHGASAPAEDLAADTEQRVRDALITLGGADTGSRARPTTPALTDARSIAKVLRAFTRDWPSPWREVVDEEETAVRAAQDGRWLPQMRPERWRRFEIALVVDTSESMDLWRHTTVEFRDLLVRQGAFRDVRTYLTDCSRPVGRRLRLTTETGSPRAWRELVDPNRRRLILMLTDAIAPAWHNQVAARMLARWGRSMPVALVQTMPQRLWHWGGVNPSRMRLSASLPGLPNRQLRVTTTESREPATNSGVVIPVLGLAAEWMAGWAQLVATPEAGEVETTAVIVHTNNHETTAPHGDHTDLGSARRRVLRFRTFASVQAFQLAGLLAAAPLSLPVMRLVQQVFLPGSDQSVLAEVLLGGLLHRLPAGSGGQVRYEFDEGVRVELLAGAYRSDTMRVARLVGDYARADVPALANFLDALDQPESASYPEISVGDLPYLRVQEAVFRALSGDYAHRARWLRRQLAGFGGATDTAAIPGVRKGSPMTTPPAQWENTPSKSAWRETSVPTARSTRSPVRLPQIWGAVPLRNPDFVGRGALLAELARRLAEPGTTAVLPEALHGMGGVGKSQTVIEYIWRHAGEYDIVWWIPAEHVTQIRSSFVELAEKLKLNSGGGADTAVPAVLEALRKGEPYSRWLLVFDNADRTDHVKPFFPAGTGHIVVTSRNPEWAGVARTVEVDLFLRDESKQLIRGRSAQIIDTEADQLAEALGDLPLAIEQAAIWLSTTGMPVDQYLHLLDQNRTELLESGTSGDYQLPVAAAWNVPLAKLRDDHPAALELLQVCAFFGPEPIARSLFERLRDIPATDELRAALADPVKLGQAIREISRYSLAKIDHRSNSLQLHRLVQAVLRRMLDEPGQDAARHIVHLVLAYGDPGDPYTAANWSRYAELLPHVVASQALDCPDERVHSLLINLARYLSNIRDYEGAMEFGGQVLDVWRSNLDEDHQDTLTMARHYANALRRLDRFDEASELNQDTYHRLTRVFGEAHEEVLKIANELATDFRYQGLFLKELETRQATFERAVQLFGEDDPTTLRYGFNLAGSLRLVCEYERARQLDEDGLRRQDHVLGPEHMFTLHSMDGLAMDLRECGEYDAACQLAEESITGQLRIFAEDNPRLIGARRNLAVARRKAGDHKGALELSTDCFNRYRRLQGESHLDTITALMNMSTDLWHLGDYRRSREYGERSLAQFHQTFGPNHPFTHIAAGNLAVPLRLTGDIDGARELNEATLAAFRDAFSDDYPLALLVATNLASDLSALGEHLAARQLDELTYDRSARVRGDKHPSTLSVALNLSIDLTNLGQDSEADVLQARILAGFQRILGGAHPTTVAALRRERANCDMDTMQL